MRARWRRWRLSRRFYATLVADARKFGHDLSPDTRAFLKREARDAARQVGE